MVKKEKEESCFNLQTFYLYIMQLLKLFLKEKMLKLHFFSFLNEHRVL